MESILTVSVDGAQLVYRRIGKGRPLVVLNGFGATSSDWDPSFIDRLASSNELILLNNRGMCQVLLKDYDGATWVWNSGGWAAGTYTIDVWARQIGSGAAYQAVMVTTIQIVAHVPCSFVGVGAGVSSDKASPQTTGTVITFTAGADLFPAQQPTFDQMVNSLRFGV